MCFLLAVDHYGVVPLGSAGAAVLLDVLDHVCEVLRFLRHLFARPFQELEMVYLPSLFPLWIEEHSWLTNVRSAGEARLPRQSGWLLCYLDVADLHGASDEIRRAVCARHLHLNLPKALLLFVPVNTVLLSRRTQAYLPHVHLMRITISMLYCLYRVSFTAV